MWFGAGFIAWLDARCELGLRSQRKEINEKIITTKNTIIEIGSPKYIQEPRELRMTIAMNGRECEEADLSDDETGKSPHQQRKCAIAAETINPDGQQKTDNLEDKSYIEQPTGNSMRRSCSAEHHGI